MTRGRLRQCLEHVSDRHIPDNANRSSHIQSTPAELSVWTAHFFRRRRFESTSSFLYVKWRLKNRARDYAELFYIRYCVFLAPGGLQVQSPLVGSSELRLKNTLCRCRAESAKAGSRNRVFVRRQGVAARKTLPRSALIIKSSCNAHWQHIEPWRSNAR